MRFLATYIMRGRVQAMTVASVLAMLSFLFPPVSLVSAATVALVTLRNGVREGTVVLLLSVLATAVLAGLIIGNVIPALGYGLVMWLPAVLIAAVLRTARQLSAALEASVLLAVVAVCAYYLISPDPAATWFELVRRMSEPMLASAAPELDLAGVEERMRTMSHYMTGIVAAGSVGGLMLSLLLARWWQAVLYNPGGFRTEYLALRIGPKVAYCCLLFAVLAVIGGTLGEMALNALIPVAVLYATVGVAVLHSLFSAARAKSFLLPLLYIVIFFIPHALAPVAAVGFADTWLDLRRRVSG